MPCIGTIHSCLFVCVTQVPNEDTADEAHEAADATKLPPAIARRHSHSGGSIIVLSGNKAATRRGRSAAARRSASLRLASTTTVTDASHHHHHRLGLPGHHHGQEDLESAAAEAVAAADAMGVTAVVSPKATRTSLELTHVKPDGTVLHEVKVAGNAHSSWPATGELWTEMRIEPLMQLVAHTNQPCMRVLVYMSMYSTLSYAQRV